MPKRCSLFFLSRLILLFWSLFCFVLLCLCFFYRFRPMSSCVCLYKMRFSFPFVCYSIAEGERHLLSRHWIVVNKRHNKNEFYIARNYWFVPIIISTSMISPFFVVCHYRYGKTRYLSIPIATACVFQTLSTIVRFQMSSAYIFLMFMCVLATFIEKLKLICI